MCCQNLLIKDKNFEKQIFQKRNATCRNVYACERVYVCVWMGYVIPSV